MVSTRLMSIGSSNSDTSNAAGPSGVQSQHMENYGPAKFTRNSVTAMAHCGWSSPQSQNLVQSVKVQPQMTSTMRFLDMPQEIIEKIFGYLSFKEICKLRLVCRRVDQICGYLLNSAFAKLQTQMLSRFQDIKKKMPRRESARRNHYLACESDIIETLHMRLTLLQMSFGKHIERKHICFFPGEILDEVHSILHYIKTTPKLDLPYKVTDELFDLSTMAMEYFKEKIEPNLPEIAYFSADFLNFPTTFSGSNTSKYCLESPNLSSDSSKVDHNDPDVLDGEEFVEIPQSNMVLRKRIRKIKQGMKRYNNQLTALRQELKACKKKTAEQQKQISEQQKQLADQQKQTLEYATRLDDYDKKNEEISRKFSTLLQELNKCKTELQYWRCKSPATPPLCNTCGSPVSPHPEELQALMNQGVNPEGLGFEPPIYDMSIHSVEQGSNKSNEEETPIAKIEIDAPIKDKKSETPPCVSTNAASIRGAKRKSSEEKEDEKQTKKIKTRQQPKQRKRYAKL
ncbi:F-box protein dampened [Rhynchophorus ferrugineus]|uniref:F-box protein dampened n=1 Tax=Rhynchophorus ferrugineus TaxID=354439 RepID=UPI003FCED969